jgi:uncharacterized damage-inducible protein DinB
MEAPMTEAARIVDQIRRAAHGDAWHGPALAEVLDGVSAAEAAAHPIANAHSIWELVGHIQTWTRTVQRRFEGDHAEPTEAENFPPVPGADPAAWTAACASVLPGHPYSAYIMLHGAVQHTLYHAGQIAVLKRALAAPAS